MQGMFLIVVNAYSKWIVVMTSTTSESTIGDLRYLFSSYGLPVEIVSDKGPKFVSGECETISKENGKRHMKSASYHPASNGEADRVVRTFKQAMQIKANETGTLNQKLAVFFVVSHYSAYKFQYTTKQAVFQQKTSYKTGCGESQIA